MTEARRKNWKNWGSFLAVDAVRSMKVIKNTVEGEGAELGMDACLAVVLNG